MVTAKQLTDFFQEMSNTDGMTDERARGELWILVLLFGQIKFDAEVDIEGHLAEFLSKVQNPTEDTYLGALHLARLFGQGVQVQRKSRKRPRK